MRLLHTSDWHLGMMRSQTATYREDQQAFIDEICGVIARERVDAVLLSGDVYDTGVSRAEALGMFDAACRAICGELGCRLIVIAGNHDSGSRLAQHSALLARTGLYIAGSLTLPVTPISLAEDVTVWPVPYFVREEAAALFPEGEKPESQEAAMRAVTDSIRARLRPGFNIVMAHAYVTGAPLGQSDRAAQVGFSDAVSREVFDGFDYVALGHIHRPYAVPGTECRVRYSGSPMQYAFDEEGQVKGCVLLDTQTGAQSFIPLPPLHGRRTLEGPWAWVTDPATAQSAQNCYVRVRVTDREKSLPMRSELLALYPDLLQFQGALHEGEGGASLTAAELEDLGDIPLMKRFLKEIYALEPDARQTRMFERALQDAMGGGDPA